MAITNALMYARVSDTSGTGTGLYKPARIAATRLNYFGPHLLCTVDGTPRHHQFDRTSYQVGQRRRGQPTQLSIEFFGFTPALGDEVILGAGALTNRIFKGILTSVDFARTRQSDGRVVYACRALSSAYTVDGVRSVSAKFTTASGTTIAVALVAAYGPAGFTATHVQSGLAELAEIQFTMQSLNEALQQLCDRLGAYFYWDDDNDLHLFTTDASGIPIEALTSSNKHTRKFQYRTDIEDLRNRIFCEGDGSVISAPVPAGTQRIPIVDASMFSDSGGLAKLEAQNITYTGKVQPSELEVFSGTTSIGLAQNPDDPSAAVASGESGDVIGTVSYKVVHRLGAKGDSEPSGASSDVTVSAVSAPASAPTASVASGGSEVSGNVPTGGAYKYKVTYVTAKGETLASTESNTVSVVEVPPPLGAPASVAGTTGGSMALGFYLYAVEYVTDAGSTGIWGSVGVTLSGGNNAVSLTSIATSSDGRVTARKIYRTKVGGLGQYYLVTTINDNSTTTYTDTTADGSLSTTTAPTTNTTGWGQVDLTSIPTSGDARVTARKIYRSGVTNFAHIATINDNVTTSYTDDNGTESVGAQEPAEDTSGGGVVDVTVPVGGGDVTARRVYRTTAGGSVYKLAGTIDDNVTTAYTDSKADDRLGDDAPGLSTVRTEAGATFLPVYDLEPFGGSFVSSAGWVRINGSMVVFHASTVNAAPYGLLSGIPASGVGSITGPINAGSSVVVEPHLSGVPASGAGALQYDVAVGDSINLLVMDEDATSQSTYGEREYGVQDRRLGLDGAGTRAAAELALRKDPRVAGQCQSSDPKMRAGAPWVLNNYGISTTVTIDTVTITSPPDRPQPIAQVTFASRSLEDLYATLRDLKDRLNH